MRHRLCLGFCLALGLTLSGLSAAPVTITLTNGAVVIGEVTKREGGRIYLKADLLGDLVIEESSVASYTGGAHGAASAGANAAAPVDSHPVGAAAVAGPPPGAAPAKAYWATTISAGGSYMSAPYVQGVVRGTVPGITGARLGLSGIQKSVTAAASVVRATLTDAMSLEGNGTYADYQPNPEAVVANYSVAFAWNHYLDPRDYTVSRTTYSEDRVRNIYHSASEILGVGRKLIDTPADKLDFVPGLVLSNERKNFVYDNKWEVGYGFLESYTHNFSPTMALEERILARTLVSRSSYYAYDAYLGFAGMLSPTFGVKLGFTYNFDNSASDRTLVVPGLPYVFYPNQKGVLTFTTGFQYKFNTPLK